MLDPLTSFLGKFAHHDHLACRPLACKKRELDIVAVSERVKLQCLKSDQFSDAGAARLARNAELEHTQVVEVHFSVVIALELAVFVEAFLEGEGWVRVLFAVLALHG